MNKEKIVIMNFSGIYEQEDFYKEMDYEWLAFENLAGCNCYCDDEAMLRIQEKMVGFSEKGLHFIDSGNYHYVSRLWLEKVKKPFRMLVFDNHTDMQPPAFGGILSCGGWIGAALQELSLLKEVILVGPDQEAFEQSEHILKKRIKFLSREALQCLSKSERRAFFAEISKDLPLYISIDKDVLCKADAATTWSQGDMQLKELLEDLKLVLSQFKEKEQEILGIDICGECDLDQAWECEKNDRANRQLLELCLDV